MLVTTPESLFILLTAESGRRWLADVRTVIVDEIHAVAGDKRGAHLALSLERLDELVAARGARLQRIGLSATVRPIETAARLLVGADRPLPEIVDVGQRRDLDLAIEVPGDELGAVCTNEQWEEIYDRIAELARAAPLDARVRQHAAPRRARGPPPGRAPRRRARGRAPRQPGRAARASTPSSGSRPGELTVVVATASLELGIDVGTVDLDLPASARRARSPPRSSASAARATPWAPRPRAGSSRSPATSSSSARRWCARPARGELDRLALRDAPLDVLAQQIVAICACEERDEDRLFDLVPPRRAVRGARRASDFDQVVDMLSEGIATRRGPHAARLHRDGVARRLKARRGARLAALTSGGAIPDNANYDVVLEPDETTIGTLDEDFAIESMAGDIFLLGNTSWRIRRVESGARARRGRRRARRRRSRSGSARARRARPSCPRRSPRLRQGVADRLHDPASATAWLERETGLDRRGAQLARDYVAAANARARRACPPARRVVAERFFDEAGGMQLVIHAPFGGRINRAWGLALRKRLLPQLRLRAAGRGHRRRHRCSRSARSTASRSRRCSRSCTRAASRSC